MKIIDSIMFFNELDIVECRLEYLYDHVDHFVITESNYTHSGQPKPLHFYDNISRYAKYKDKIIYNPWILTANDYAEFVRMDCGGYENVHWLVEKAQRNFLTNVLDQFDDNDIFIVADADEIPNVAIFEEIKHCYSFPDSTPRVLAQEYFCYNLERKLINPGGMEYWYVPYVAQKHHFSVYNPSQIRGLVQTDIPRLCFLKGGWHLHCFMSAQDIILKLKSYAHQEFNKDEYLDVEQLEKWISENKSYIGNESEFEFVTPDHFPQDFLEIFGKYFHINTR